MAHRDPRGNVIALTNATSKSVGRSYTYTSWGKAHTGADGAGFNEVDRARWKGALWFDEIGLYYMRARWYDPSLGRFISEDPIGLEGGINNYAFAGGDPVNGADPTGLDWICVVDATGLISKCWWRFDDIEVVAQGPDGGGDWWDREADLFGEDLGLDAEDGRAGLPGANRFRDRGIEAERACALAAGLAPLMIAADLTGARATLKLVGAVGRFGIASFNRWLIRSGVKRVSPALGWDATVEVAQSRAAASAAAYGTISVGAESIQFVGTVTGGFAPPSAGGFLLGFVPLVTTYQTVQGVQQKCFNPTG